ncbi:hypothetical protein CALVIDRAFT_290194 [Calocera viscosa TUFC12733]|uniref:Uncharacterized protein n=1 Tax=Calocera viscosa (strain TUFC12733) TaxID=1330018 RepID=A0A167IQR2_CALVF|nr:hypothetical protein CALVIDRAFT_290194 [Calocera viscosa TUFC12733]
MAEPGAHYCRMRASPIAEDDWPYRRSCGGSIDEATMSYHRAWDGPTAEPRQGLSPSLGRRYHQAVRVLWPIRGMAYHRDLAQPCFMAEPCGEYHRAWPTLWPKPVSPMAEAVHPYGRALPALCPKPISPPWPSLAGPTAEPTQPYGPAWPRQVVPPYGRSSSSYVRNLWPTQLHGLTSPALWPNLASPMAETSRPLSSMEGPPYRRPGKPYHRASPDLAPSVTLPPWASTLTVMVPYMTSLAATYVRCLTLLPTIHQTLQSNAP